MTIKFNILLRYVTVEEGFSFTILDILYLNIALF